jgi:phosphoenolpyruvate synthase/pyruvate phosphate dikinase
LDGEGALLDVLVEDFDLFGGKDFEVAEVLQHGLPLPD